MSFEDKTLTCSDCDKSFTFSVDEQEQFQSRGYTNEPKRCPECRQARKAQQNRLGGSSFGNSNSGYTAQREMFPAVCSDCYRKVRVGR